MRLRSNTKKQQKILRSGKVLNNTQTVRTKQALKSLYDRKCVESYGANWGHKTDLAEFKTVGNLLRKYPKFNLADCKKRVGARAPPSGGNPVGIPSNFPTNLGDEGIYLYLMNYHLGRKNKIPMPSASIKPGYSNENRCLQNSNQLTATQAMMHAIATAFAQGRLTNKGLLGWHSTGSGKTCSAACVMDAFLGTDLPIVYCTTVEGKRSNGPEKFQDCMDKYFDGRLLGNRVKYLTFAQLAHKLDLYRGTQKANAKMLDRGVLIIDEVQNLLKPLPTQVREHKALEKFLLRNDKPNLKIIILTATPGESVKDVYRLLNIVRDRKHSPLTENDDEATVMQKTRGIVQHYDSNTDTTRFPVVTMHPPSSCTMSTVQTKEYLKKYKEREGCKTEKCFNLKTKTLRKYGNSLYNRGDYSIRDFSCKFDNILKEILSKPREKHWVYSSFFENKGYGQGVMGLKRALISDFGYEELTSKDARDPTKLSPKKRFCMATNPSLKGKAALPNLLETYNSDLNKNGQLCHIMLASNKFNEGTDLKAVRNVHIVEAQTSAAIVDQAIGRARRNCSHKSLPKSEWTVAVRQYLSAPQNGESIDQEVIKTSIETDRPLKKLYTLLKRVSVNQRMFD